LQTSSTTKTTTLTTPAKLYGKDLSEYDEIDVDELLSQLSPEEINILAKEVDPDVSTIDQILWEVCTINEGFVAGQLFTTQPKAQL
jgi:Tropomodulin